MKCHAIRRTSRRHLGVLLAVGSAVAALLCAPLVAAAPSALAATQPVSYQAPGTPYPSVAGATTPFTTYSLRQVATDWLLLYSNHSVASTARAPSPAAY
jgi:hypothetical protein